MDDLRPPESYSREEIQQWMKRNRRFRQFYDARMSNHLALGHSRRGIPRWAFGAGYLAGQYALLKELLDTGEELDATIKRETERIISKHIGSLTRRMKLGE